MLYIIRQGTSTPEQSPWYRPWIMGTYVNSRIYSQMAYQTSLQRQVIGDNSHLFDKANIWFGLKFQAGTPWSFNNLTVRWLPNSDDPFKINVYGALERAQDGKKTMYYIGTMSARTRETFDVQFTNLKATNMFQIYITKQDGSEFGMVQLPKTGLDGWMTYGILPKFNDLNGRAPQDIPFLLS